MFFLKKFGDRVSQFPQILLGSTNPKTYLQNLYRAFRFYFTFPEISLFFTSRSNEFNEFFMDLIFLSGHFCRFSTKKDLSVSTHEVWPDKQKNNYKKCGETLQNWSRISAAGIIVAGSQPKLN